MKKTSFGLLLSFFVVASNLSGICLALTLKVTLADGGNNHTVALREDGSLWSFGYNYYGQLGDGTNVNKNNPVRMSDLADVVSLVSSSAHNLAVRSDGTVWAWGINGYGQLGDGTKANQHTPVQVKDPSDLTGFLTGVVQVAAGDLYSMALKSDGTVWAWGYNYSGQLGDGTYIGKTVPVQVKGSSGYLGGVVAIAAGGSHSVALRSDGTVWTWGTRDYAVLGRMYYDAGSVPQDVAGPAAGLAQIVAIAAGWEHTLALRQDGTVWACGRNQEGQLGDGTTVSSVYPPPVTKFFVQVKDPVDAGGYLTGITKIAADGRFSLAVKNDGSAWAWGANNGGQLCSGAQENKIVATRMKDPLDPSGFLTAVSGAGAGGYHSLLVKKDGTVWGCGWNDSGQLGNGTFAHPKLFPEKALIPEYSLIYAWGYRYVTPGEVTTFLVEYHNILAQTIQNAVAIFYLPGDFTYHSSSQGGIYRDDRHQVFWKLGHLSPGAKGILTLKMEVPWELPLHQKIEMYVDMTAENITSSTVAADYLNYVPVQTLSEKSYTPTEISALLAGDPELKRLYDYALSQGFSFDQVARRYDLSDGSSNLVLAFLNPPQASPVFLKKAGSNAFLEKYEDSAYSLFDQDGGFREDWNDNSFRGWGTWAVAHSQERDKCTYNCLFHNPKWNHYMQTKQFRQTSRDCLTCQAAMKEGKKDPASCAACARMYIDVNRNRYPRFAGSIEKCIGDCRMAPNTWACEPSETRRSCNIDAVWALWLFLRPLATKVDVSVCRVDSTGSRWVLDRSQQEICQYCECIETPEPHCGKPCSSTARFRGNRALPGAFPNISCEPYITKIVTEATLPDDPNAKSVDFAGEVIPGQSLTYRIDYENLGEGTAYNVFVLDELDPNLDEATLSIGNSGTYSGASRLLGWEIGTLAAHGKGYVTFRVHVKTSAAAGTEITNLAKVYFPTVNQITPTNPVSNRVAWLAADPKEVTATSAVAASIRLSGRDSGSVPLTYRITRPPSFGTLAGTPPDITYTSILNFSGGDEFYYLVRNGSTDSVPARVAIAVHPGSADTAPPAVTGTFPEANAGDIHYDPNPVSAGSGTYAPNLRATFSEPVDSATLTASTFSVSGGMTGTVTYNEATWTAFFAPGKAFSPSTAYTATLGSGIRDKAGNPMAAAYSWTFTTESPTNIVVMLSDGGTGLNFGKVPRGATSPDKVVNILSTGTQNLVIGSIGKTGADAADFKILEDPCSGRTLAPSANCTVRVAFQPSALTGRSALLTMPSNDPDHSVIQISLAGEGTYTWIYLPLLMR